MADILLYQFVKREFQHLMPELSFNDPTGREQQKKELEEFLTKQNNNAEHPVQPEPNELG